MTYQSDPNRPSGRWTDRRNNTLGIASLVIGIIAVVVLGFLIFGGGEEAGTVKRDTNLQTRVPSPAPAPSNTPAPSTTPAPTTK
jgi:hypothetical protein